MIFRGQLYTRHGILTFGILLFTMLFLALAPALSVNVHGPAVVIHGGRDAIVQVLVAATPDQWETGLMYRRNLPENQGMLFIFQDEAQRGFWMKNTYLSLDQLYIRGDGVIVDINKNARPLSLGMYMAKPSSFVLEVNGGYCDRHGIKTGDRIELIP